MRTFLALCLGIITILAGITPSKAQVAGPFETVYRTATNYRGGTDTLRMRWWLPSEQVSSPLPLIVWVHGGAFYTGNYGDMTAECQRWAARGYAAVTLQYRLGFYGPPPLDPPYAYDPTELIRACWRAMQDVRFGIRALVRGEVIPNIDSGCVILGGESAGAIAIMQAVIADGSDSIPKEVDSTTTVVRGFDKFTRPSLGNADGFPIGSKVAYVPMPRICGVINRYGAIVNPYMVDAKEFPPIISFHQRGDIIVPCEVNRGLWGMPLGVGDNYPVIYGSCYIDRLLEEGGHPAALRQTTIVEGSTHGLDNPTQVYAREEAFAQSVMCPTTSSVDDNQNASQPEAWVLYDVLGQPVASGHGTEQSMRAWIYSQAPELLEQPLYLQTTTARRLLWQLR